MNKRSIAKAVAVWIAGAVPAMPVPASAGCDDLSEVVGFTLVADTRVQGEFQGCAFDRLVEFENGLTLRCSENRPKRAAHPKAQVFLRNISMEGGSIPLVKACIDGEIYTMRKP